MSPTAKMSGSEVRSAASTAILAAAQLQARGVGQGDVRDDPDADHDRLGLDRSTTDHLHRRHAAVSTPENPGAQSSTS